MPSLAHSFSVSISPPLFVTFSWFLPFSFNSSICCLFPPNLQASLSCHPFNFGYLSGTCYKPSTEFFTSLSLQGSISLHFISPSSPLVRSFCPLSCSLSPSSLTSSSTSPPSLKRKDTLRLSLCPFFHALLTFSFLVPSHQSPYLS